MQGFLDYVANAHDPWFFMKGAPLGLEQLQLSVKSLKAGQKHGLDPSQKEISNNSFTLSCLGAYFKSWVKLLGPLLSTPKDFERIIGLKIWLHMALFMLKHGSAYASLGWCTHPSTTTQKAGFDQPNITFLWMVIHSLRKVE